MSLEIRGTDEGRTEMMETKVNLAEDGWVNAVLRYADPIDMTGLVEFVRQRFEAGLNADSAEHEYDAYVDALVADYYG
jgi:hypothetical protein